MNAVTEQENAAVSITLPTVIGAPFGGGFFAGVFIKDGKRFALIVAPKDGGEVVMPWAADSRTVTGAESYVDGQSNTRAMAESGSPLGAWALALHLNGMSDWYIPGRDELELMYRNLKPTTQENDCSFRDGDNGSSVPVGFPYTESSPAITSADNFKAGAREAFDLTWYWASTQYAANPSYAWLQYFYYGFQIHDRKSYEGRARAVRRFAI